MSKKKSTGEKLDDALNLAEETIEELSPSVEENPIVIKKTEFSDEEPSENVKKEGLNADFKKARDTLSHLIDKGTHALDKVLLLANDSDSPRVFEVTATLINAVGNTAKDLLDLQKKLDEIQNPKGGSVKKEPVRGKEEGGNTTIFVGTAAELDKIMDNK